MLVVRCENCLQYHYHHRHHHHAQWWLQVEQPALLLQAAAQQRCAAMLDSHADNAEAALLGAAWKQVACRLLPLGPEAVAPGTPVAVRGVQWFHLLRHP